MSKYIKFTGKYRDLKPQGYEFQKMYARNYNTWWKRHKEHDGFVIVWQKGAELEINDWHHLSAYVMEFLLTQELPWRKFEHPMLGKSTWLSLTANRETCAIRDRDSEIDDPTYFWGDFNKEHDRYPNKDEAKVWKDAHDYHNKREIVVDEEFYHFLMDIWNTGNFEIR